MANTRLSMRKIKEILRLSYQCGLSRRQIERFPDAKRLCSYAGLVPSIYSSGSKTYHGRIRAILKKCGNRK